VETYETHPLVIGIDSFGDITSDDEGRPLDQPENTRALVEEGVLAEASGLDFFGLGEHHVEEMPLSAPDLVLAAVSARTSRIRLGSAVTVLSSDDPVRVFQRYATLDALSHGRAEVILGRGSSKESFPLFGFDLADYDRLFEEKLELFAALRSERPVTWSGTTRAALSGLQVFPRTASGRWRHGSVSAPAPPRSSGPRSTASTSCSRSSAATRPGSPGMRNSSDSPRHSSGTARGR
jgi:alkanesulfonate monooxygenase SsuD/methylene tetrahydromethanopterin reductase-like flavin-dependent oxidoreductase (luciferase family)